MPFGAPIRPGTIPAVGAGHQEGLCARPGQDTLSWQHRRSGSRPRPHSPISGTSTFHPLPAGFWKSTRGGDSSGRPWRLASTQTGAGGPADRRQIRKKATSHPSSVSGLAGGSCARCKVVASAGGRGADSNSGGWTLGGRGGTRSFRGVFSVRPFEPRYGPILCIFADVDFDTVDTLGNRGIPRHFALIVEVPRMSVRPQAGRRSHPTCSFLFSRRLPFPGGRHASGVTPATYRARAYP